MIKATAKNFVLRIFWKCRIFSTMY